MFIPCEITKTAFGTDNEVLMKYISENLGGTIPEQYRQNENRIVKTNEKDNDDDNNNNDIFSQIEINNNNNVVRAYHKKSSGGLSGGAIALIVLAPIVVLGILGATIYLVKTKSSNKIPEAQSQNSVKIMNDKI